MRILALLVLTWGAVPEVFAQTGANVFSEIWTVPYSQYGQSDQFANSLTQLANGTIVAGGGDGYQMNVCGQIGGAWLVAVDASGANVWQRLDADCAGASQVASVIRATKGGGFVLAGGDGSNPACYGCAWLARLTNAGGIAWQEDLTTFFLSAISGIRQTPDGGYIAVGNVTPATTYAQEGLVMKLSAAGALEWSQLYAETADSFPGALADGPLVFRSVAPTPDGGYVVSGVAEAHFSVYANVLLVAKLDPQGNIQWSNVYFSSTWGSGAPGDSQYAIFPAANGGYMLSGVAGTIAYPFAKLFLLMKLDSTGRPVWQTGYGALNGIFNVSVGTSAYATPDGGYVLAGTSDAFLSGPYEYYTGWMLKTDATGNILWQKVYEGEPQQNTQFGDVIRTADGGYAAAGYSYVGSPAYGGPGFFVIKTDSTGAIGNCACVEDTSSSPLRLNLSSYTATFSLDTSQVSLSAVTNIRGKPTNVTPIVLYPGN